METALLQTKLYIPPARPVRVLRPRLTGQLTAGLHRKLSLVSAPAGFGKTTLVSEWIHQGAPRETPLHIAWLSLDEGDNDPVRFLSYFIAALQTVKAALGNGVLDVLRSPQPPPIEAILTALINEIAALPDRLVLILDDYHAIEAPPVHELLAFLVAQLPSCLHLILTTREDPPLPLARYRARGQLTELRAADLRFTPAEAAEFLNQVMGLRLSEEDVAALERRTEGWIAGLQLAALSMQGRADVAGFIQAFTGSHRFVMDYLVAEVLHCQPARIRDFLLQTSILDRVCGPLCDAVTGQETGWEMLEALERRNLFVVPLDDRRQWYRYHHLFAGVLQAHLVEEHPGLAPDLHRRASVWYEQHDLPSAAIHHALAIPDFERAAGLLELAWPAMEAARQAIAWFEWVKRLPDALIRARPVLSVALSYALLARGELEAASVRLDDAEYWVQPETRARKHLETALSEGHPESCQKMIVVDAARFRTLPAEIAISRAYVAQACGDIPGTVKYARRALDLASETDALRRWQATTLLGLTYWASGDLEPADRIFADFTGYSLSAGDLPDAISTAFVVAEIRMALGRLHAAQRVLVQVLQRVLSQGEPVLPEAVDLYRGLSALSLEWGELEAAEGYLRSAKSLGDLNTLLDWQRRLCVAEARLKQTQGDLAGALDLLDEAERLRIRIPLPDVRPIAALRVRIWLEQGRMAEALAWVQEQGLSVDDDLSYLHEFEHLTLARVRLARYPSAPDVASLHETLDFLDRLLQAADAGNRLRSVIEILALQACAHEAQGNTPRALVALERALALAEPEGYVRIFVDAGRPLAALLSRVCAAEADRTPRMQAYCDTLAAAFDNLLSQSSAIQEPLASPATQAAGAPSLIEPLTPREREVLQLIAAGYSNPEIAAQLVIAATTVKTHAKNIYGKLGVSNRFQAAARAKDLQLL